MPLYEYTCQMCRKRFSVLVGMTAAADAGSCPHCGSNQATRRITRFAVARGEDALLDDVDMPGDPDDPYAMRRWADGVGDVMGESLGDEFDEYLDGAA